jgi:hypothetical protein
LSQSVAVLGSNAVPLSYKVPVPGTLTAISASAVFDGTSAATFIPCLSFYDSDGNLLARATAPVVAAGASAEVSWFPRVAQAASGGGIDFDKDNEGGWLYVQTNAVISGIGAGYDGYGMALVEHDNAGILIDSDLTVNVNTVQSGNVVVGQPANGQTITLNAALDNGGNPIVNGSDGVNPTTLPPSSRSQDSHGLSLLTPSRGLSRSCRERTSRSPTTAPARATSPSTRRILRRST